MKLNKSIIIAFLLLIVISSLYRVWENRPWGFAPQIAMALFGGAVIKDKKWAFILPLLSMFLSDVLYEILYVNGLTELRGFYKGQITNYILFAGLTFFGFLIKKINWVNVLAASLIAPTLYFIASNFFVWLSATGGLQRPKTFNGLLMCYNDGLPFYKGYILGTLFFSTILFGGYYLITRYVAKNTKLATQNT